MKYLAKMETGEEKHFEILKEIKENENLFNKCMEKLKEFYEAPGFRKREKPLHNSVIIIEKLPSWILVLEMIENTAKKYRLLSNDALIAAVCKYYGIKKIVTFENGEVSGQGRNVRSCNEGYAYR